MKLGKTGVVLATGCVCGLLAAASSHALVISQTNSSEVIVDGSSDTRAVTVGVADLGGALNRVKDVNITIDLMKCADADGALGTPLPAACPGLGLFSAFANEIRFLLTSPSATVITLVDANTYDSGAPGTRVTVTFDDNAANGLSTDPASGTFQPVGLLSTFNGSGALGDWELFIEDTGGGDPLGFARFTLDVTVCDQADTDPICQRSASAPVPATALLLGLGLAGLAASRKRRN